MSFMNQVAALNECGTLNNSGCTYDAFMNEMRKIKQELYEAVTVFNKETNMEAISSILEGTELSTELRKDNLVTKLKDFWDRIVNWFFDMLDTIYSWAYEQIVLQTKYIENHKDEIMKTTLVYGKQKTDILDANKKKIASYTLYISVPELESFENILSPKFFEPLITESELKDYIKDNKVDTQKLYNYYKDEILGNRKSIDIDIINNKKSELLDGMKSCYEEVKTRKSKIIAIKKRYQNPPKELSAEGVKEFQAISMAQIASLRAYNKVAIEYCKAASTILKKYIRSADIIKKGDK